MMGIVARAMLAVIAWTWSSASLASAEDALDKALVAHLEDKATPHYDYAFYDLNGDGIKDAVVLMTGRDFCGSGGCMLLVFEGTPDSFRFRSMSTISRQPIKVLRDSHSGWKSLGVLVAGGGATPGSVVMRFNANDEKYPLNPTMQPYASKQDLKGAITLRFKSHDH